MGRTRSQILLVTGQICFIFGNFYKPYYEGICYDQWVLLRKLYEPLPCFILYSKAKFASYIRYFLTSYFCIPVTLWVSVLKGLLGLHRTVQLQLLQRYWLGHRLGLLWYWMVCLGNEQRSFCRFWDCIQVLHFRLFCWLWWLLHFF